MKVSPVFQHLGIKAAVGKVAKAAPRGAASFKGRGKFGNTFAAPKLKKPR